MLNQITLVGRVVRNPELKKAENGREFAIVTLAIARPFKSQATNDFESDFIDVSVWGTNAINASKYCGKGSIIAIRGRVANRTLDFPGRQIIRTIGIIGERISFVQTKPPVAEAALPPKDTAEEEADKVNLDDMPLTEGVQTRDEATEPPLSTITSEHIQEAC